MKAAECTKLFELYYKLLAFYQPSDAVLWLCLPQKILEGQVPCELLSEKNGFARVLQAIREMGTSYS